METLKFSLKMKLSSKALNWLVAYLQGYEKNEHKVYQLFYLILFPLI